MQNSVIAQLEYERRQKSRAQKVKEHPCYGEGAHFKFGRVHLPVVAGCNIGCNYCVRKFDCVNESKPGITSKIITPQQAIERVRCAIKAEPRIRVVGIAGPGEPLSSEATFETLALVQKEFPHLKRCLSTNGLLLPQKLQRLKDVDLTTLTITINAIDPDIGAQIYSFVNFGGKVLRGKEAFEVLSKNQLEGLSGAVEAGFIVKVNSVYIPGVNSKHLTAVAEEVKKRGAYVMNIMPLIPQAKFADVPAPSMQELKSARDACEGTLFQFRNCMQCRADAVGVPGDSCGSPCSKLDSYKKVEVN
ncbi:MAG: radical SAM protein [Candidatus Bathyarchaeota archaeon]|nr:radical SAM protein [Candidatus Bathyarchaeota archaeon]